MMAAYLRHRRAYHEQGARYGDIAQEAQGLGYDARHLLPTHGHDYNRDV